MDRSVQPSADNRKCLMVVESPSKCKTLKKFLGSRFSIMASYGHVRDLPTKRGVVDPDHGFAAHYIDIERNIRHVREIARKMKEVQVLYLATDPDREGEAIAGHIAEILKEKKLLKDREVHRIAFSEINETAVREAIRNPRELSSNLIDAQRARRILDHLVGFNLSPLLWKKIHSGLSAGRVQSPALRLIVEREEEIEKFVSREYWTIDALCAHKDEPDLCVRLIEFDGKKLEKFSIDSSARAQEVRARIENDSKGTLVVRERKTSERKIRPYPPYMTSTLLQDASNKLDFDQRRTMRVAQRLYEGIDIDGTPTSLITYMRTDSFNISNQAVARIRDVIGRHYGQEMLPEKSRHYKKKSKTSQEAHEAIRPSDPTLLPSQLSGKVASDELRLYALVWARAVASQMADAKSETDKILLGAGEGHIFQLSGSRIVFDGHLAVQNERRHAFGKRQEAGGRALSGQDDTPIPDLPVGTELQLHEIRPAQHFTKPPARYTVASLVEALDSYGIGRPSTYASIVSILEQRNYVELKAKNFHPTEMGIAVNKFLVEHFKRYVDYEFTAKLEDQLDEIADGREQWRDFLGSFWHPFNDLVKEKTETVSRKDSIGERILGVDPKSGRTVSVRIGRFGPYAQIGVRDDEEKPRFVSIPPNMKLSEIDLKTALRFFDLPRQIGQTSQGEDISVAIGRYGPYIRFGDRFAALEDQDDPYTIDLNRALVLIDKRIELDRKRTVKSFDNEKIRVMRTRFGHTIVMGSKKKNLPKDFDIDKLGMEECLQMLESAEKQTKKNGATRASKAGAKTASAAGARAGARSTRTRKAKAG